MKEPPQTALHTNTTHICMCTHELVHTRIHTSHTSPLLLFLLITSSLLLLYASENQKLTLGLGKTKVWQDCFGGRIPPFFLPFPASSSSPYFLALAPTAISKASNCSLRPLCAPLWSLLKSLAIPQALLKQPGVLSPFSGQLH